jgi:hypothetical protein
VLFIGYGETDEARRSVRPTCGRRGRSTRIWRNCGAYAGGPGDARSHDLIDDDYGCGTAPPDRPRGKVAGANGWAAILGPDVPALGVRRNTPMTQSQIAATIAAALGYDWPREEPRAAKPLPAFGR